MFLRFFLDRSTGRNESEVTERVTESDVKTPAADLNSTEEIIRALTGTSDSQTDPATNPKVAVSLKTSQFAESFNRENRIIVTCPAELPTDCSDGTSKKSSYSRLPFMSTSSCFLSFFSLLRQAGSQQLAIPLMLLASFGFRLTTSSRNQLKLACIYCKQQANLLQLLPSKRQPQQHATVLKAFAVTLLNTHEKTCQSLTKRTSRQPNADVSASGSYPGGQPSDCQLDTTYHRDAGTVRSTSHNQTVKVAYSVSSRSAYVHTDTSDCSAYQTDGTTDHDNDFSPVLDYALNTLTATEKFLPSGTPVSASGTISRLSGDEIVTALQSYSDRRIGDSLNRFKSWDSREPKYTIETMSLTIASSLSLDYSFGFYNSTYSSSGRLTYYTAPSSSSRRREEAETGSSDLQAVQNIRRRYVPFERNLHDEQEREANNHRSLFQRFTSFAGNSSWGRSKTLGYMLAQLGFYLAPSFSQSKVNDKIRCCFCKRGKFNWWAYVYPETSRSFAVRPTDCQIAIAIARWHSIKSPTCPRVLDLKVDAVDELSKDQLNIINSALRNDALLALVTVNTVENVCFVPDAQSTFQFSAEDYNNKEAMITYHAGRSATSKLILFFFYLYYFAPIRYLVKLRRISLNFRYCKISAVVANSVCLTRSTGHSLFHVSNGCLHVIFARIA